MRPSQSELIIETEAPGSRSSAARWRWPIALIISAVLITPCFWHHHLEAGDFGSHAYNAWLVQLIEQGKAPGLSIVTQWNNVFFDFLLSGLGHVFALPIGGQIAAALAVLIFFWGAFSFVHAVADWLPWPLAPLLAMISYGWTFNAGLFNYYISLGLAFFALAIVYRGWRQYWFAALLLVPLMYLAHPLGFCWAFAAGLYIVIASRIPRRMHPLLFAGALCILYGARFYLRLRAVTKPPSHSVLFYNGLDQIFFTNRYGILVLLLWCLIVVAFAAEFLRNKRILEFQGLLLALELYLLVEAGIQLLPDSILFAHSAAQFSELTDRLTSISAVLLCCLFACAKAKRWALIGTSIVAAIFFLFLYQDTGAIGRMEMQAEALVHSRPEGQRVISTIDPPLKYRFSVRHILDQACLGYCFNYGNYEPATQQFRVRASPGNAFVVSQMKDSLAIDAGTYVVPSSAMPLFQIYQCGPTWTKLCIRSPRVDEPVRVQEKPQ